MTNKALTLGSLFDGSGAFPFGGILAGIEPKWNSEIEPFPVLVTHKRLPQVKHYGDVSGLKGGDLEPVDIITFGSPCQDMSIAGKRAGLDGARSGLFHQAIRIIKEMREKTNGQYPRYCVWENVPGAFSSNGGGDFKAVLEAVIGVKEEGIEVPAPQNHRWPKSDVLLGNGWSLAYRVLDAQYWSVPQRRARIYLVADFAGGSAPEILFKSEGLSGYTPQGFRAWQGAAGGAEEGAGEAGGRPDAGSGVLCVNTQGNSGVGITEDKSLALVAQDHGNHPAVLQAAGFSTEHSAQSRSIGYEEEMSPTLRAGVVPATMMFDNHPQDCRYDGPMENSPTVTARYGTGGNNQPLVAEPEPITLKIRSGCIGGGKGQLTQVNKSATLGTHNDQTLFQPEKPDIKAYGVCSKSSHAMLSDNPHSGFYEAKTSRTLDRSGGNAVTSNQGGICVVAPEPAYALQGSMIGREDKNGPQGDGINEEVSFTLNTIDRHCVAAPAEDEATWCATTGSFMTVEKERAHTLMARDYKDPQIVNDTPNDEPVYIVRRLTPVECARLQGFPDWWCEGLSIPDPDDEEVAFWLAVWNTWQSMTNPEGKPKTEKQIRRWLADPYTDAAEYKLWGNGCALPCVFFVLSGIVWAAGKEEP
jgi:DNA (cytosine-5)-methyltransferase 1